MGSYKWRQGMSLNIKDVRLLPRPLTEAQVARKKATDDAEGRVSIAKRVADWLYGRTA